MLVDEESDATNVGASTTGRDALAIGRPETNDREPASRPLLSVVVPVYRAQQSLVPLVERLHKVLGTMGVSYEIILVDDASPDGSWRVMEQLQAFDPRLKIVQHMRNFGQHKATLCGMTYAAGDIIVTIDDDLQHPPEEIPKLYAALGSPQEPDAVIGAYEQKQHSWFRNAGSRAIHRITSYVFGTDPKLQLTSFRVLRRAVVDVLVTSTAHNPRIGQLLLMTTNRIVNVPVEHHPRVNGVSGYRLSRLVSDALDNILSNSALPLQLVSYLGFGCSALSCALSLYYLGKYALGGVGVAGWTTIVLLLLFFFGLVFFSLGVVGEYLVRILRQVQQSPRSIVRRERLEALPTDRA